MEADTLLLYASLLMIFIAVFGGGFEFKGLKIPRVHPVSRLAGLLLGGILLVYSQCLLAEYIPTYCDRNDKTADTTSTEKAGISPPDIDFDPREKYDDLEQGLSDLQISNVMLLEEYRKLQNPESYEKLSISQKDRVNKQIDLLEKSIASFDTLKSQDTGPLTIDEKLKLWQWSVNIARLSDENRAFADSRIRKYESDLATWASVTQPGDFVTCESVRQKMPFHVKKTFASGDKVWIWARVNVPQTNELLKIEWVNPKTGQLLDSMRNLKVYRSPSYRTYYHKTFYRAADYEVRLFNGQNQLIARRRFTVEQD